MFIEDFNKEDYVVVNDNNKRNFPCRSVNVDTFLEEAGEGLELGNGDLYCYIPDFDKDLYSEINESAPDTKWFVYDRTEIPNWFKADEAHIIRSKNDKPSEKKVPDSAAKKKTSEFGRPSTKTPNKEKSDNSTNDDVMAGVGSLFENFSEDSIESGNKEAKIYVFGSSKGGTGKTFTCLISAYRYAKLHPGEKIAVADFDIIDGQVGISIMKIQPTMMSYWKNFVAGDDSFKTMHQFSTKSEKFPSNIDFYLAPKDYYINDKKFWLSILDNLVKNYDTVFFDTGIDYINYPPISFAYKIADRIVLTSTTSIKSVSSVLKQISKLKGTSSSANANGTEIFKAEDNIGPKLRLAVTRYNEKDSSNTTVIQTFSKNVKISAIFGMYDSDISRAEYYGEWNIFDGNKQFNSRLDKLVDLED
jgi:cellulose biosynthesis protein BcsQ